MFVNIQNLIEERTFLRFNSGRTHQLAPLATLQDVPHTEIKGNVKLDKLQQRNIIAVAPANAATEAAAPQSRSQRTTKRRTTAGQA